MLVTSRLHVFLGIPAVLMGRVWDHVFFIESIQDPLDIQVHLRRYPKVPSKTQQFTLQMVKLDA